MNPTRSKSGGIRRLIRIAGQKKWWLIGSMILAIGAAVAQFIPYVAVYNIIENLVGNSTRPDLINYNAIRFWAYVSLWSVCGYGVLFYISNMLSHIAAFNILYDLRVSLARKLVRLPLGFFSRKSSGEIKKVMAEDVERIELFVAHHIPDFTTAVVFPLLIMVYLLMVDWRLALIVLAVFVAALVMQGIMMHSSKAKRQIVEYHHALAGMNNSIVEYVRGIQVVKIFNRSSDAFERLRNDIDAFRNYSVGVSRAYSMTYTGFLTLISSVLLFLIPAGLMMVVHAENYQREVSVVLLFLVLGSGLFFPMLKLMWIVGLLGQNDVGVAQVDGILDRPEIPESGCPLVPRDVSISFINVSFSYQESPVLRNITFTARPGTVTALVGPSGAGKSTIGMLTARFWDVDAGEIQIGGVPIRLIPGETLMNHVGFVFQDNMLFYDTIEENIRMGNRNASLEEVKAAAVAARCHEFIDNLEHGYATLVGEGGTYLSGGEQQRIALARAILKNTPIVLLDEATAYADPENEAKILESFSRLIKGKTVLVIAHHLSTIVNADQILVIENGTIAERGRHPELLAMEGKYARMWQTYSQSREWVLSRGDD